MQIAPNTCSLIIHQLIWLTFVPLKVKTTLISGTNGQFQNFFFFFYEISLHIYVDFFLGHAVEHYNGSNSDVLLLKEILPSANSLWFKCYHSIIFLYFWSTCVETSLFVTFPSNSNKYEDSLQPWNFDGVKSCQWCEWQSISYFIQK